MASPNQNAVERDERSAPGERAVVSKVEARQGVTGHNVRYVLGFSLAAIVIAFAVLYFIYFV